MVENGKSCVLVAFKDRKTELHECLDRLLPQLSPTVHVLLIDDGSASDIRADAANERVIGNDYVHLIRQPSNRGVSAARNTGVSWCLEHGYEIVIMTDSDCLVPADFVRTHLDLHRENPDIPVIGGSINGIGATFWARLDRMMTWFHCIPGAQEGILQPSYTAPTANISVKIGALPFDDAFFDSYLRTGEDTAFSRKVRAAGYSILFSPRVEINHRDREGFVDFVKHQYEFGRHHYVILHRKFGLDGICFNPLYRLIFTPAFVLALPVYSVLGCWLNMVPWIRRDPLNALYWPPLQAIWLVKGVAMLESAIFPKRAFRLDANQALPPSRGSG